MILLTRLNGSTFGINSDLIERVETTVDTVVSLIDGTKYVVSESPADVVERIVEFRSRVLAATEVIAQDQDPDVGRGPLRLVVESAGPTRRHAADSVAGRTTERG